MAAIVFDVREAERRLLAAGAPPEVAEATADLMSNAVIHNMDSLVTREYLDHVLDARFSQHDAKWERRIAGLEAGWEQRFHALESMFIELKGQFRVMQVIQALLLAGVFLPQLRALVS